MNPRSSRSLSPVLAAACGLLSGALAVAVGMLAAGLTEVVSPIDAVGSEVIDRTPTAIREWAIRTFETNDKLVLRIGVFTVLGLAALAVGALAARRVWAGVGGIAAFGMVGALAAAGRPGESAGASVPSLLGALVGATVLYRLIRQPLPGHAEPHESQVPLGWDRRRFLIAGGVTAAAAGAAAAGGLALEDSRVQRLREEASQPLPSLDGESAAVPTGAQLYDETPYITPNSDFYRIDTAFSFPRIDVDRWRLRITGMVDHELTYSYSDLLALPQEERIVTICCVSNEVGGRYIGNAVWRGVLLNELLDEAGVQSGAEQVFSTSIDGWTCGFPVSATRDGRDAMVVLGMNGETLPLEHGYPARLVVPGLYGYVSATKWVEEIRLTTWNDATGYWIPRGWASEAPIKTQSRIDVPRDGAQLTAGRQPIAGVAWAQFTGVEQVEVQVDDGAWQTATLAADVTDDSWRQWLVQWDAEPGDHVIRVRATDKSGYTQTADEAPPAPDGATGHHTIRVTVS